MSAKIFGFFEPLLPRFVDVLTLGMVEFRFVTLTGSMGMNAKARFYANRIMLRGSVHKIPSFIAGGDVNKFVEDAFKQIIKMMSY